MDPVVITPQAMGSKIIDNNNNTSQRSRFNRIQTGTYTHCDLNGNKLLHSADRIPTPGLYWLLLLPSHPWFLRQTKRLYWSLLHYLAAFTCLNLSDVIRNILDWSRKNQFGGKLGLFGAHQNKGFEDRWKPAALSNW